MQKPQLDPSNIKVEFGGKNNPPKDEKLLELLKLAYAKKIKCYPVSLEFEGVKPFSDFEYEMTENVFQYFLKMAQDKQHHKLLVYQDEGDKFIMSDDYAYYQFCKIMQYDYVICFVLGEPKSKYVYERAQPFYLEVPDGIEVV